MVLLSASALCFLLAADAHETTELVPGARTVPLAEDDRRQHFHPLTDSNFALDMPRLAPNYCTTGRCCGTTVERSALYTPLKAHVLPCLICLSFVSRHICLPQGSLCSPRNRYSCDRHPGGCAGCRRLSCLTGSKSKSNNVYCRRQHQHQPNNNHTAQRDNSSSSSGSNNTTPTTTATAANLLSKQ